MTPTVKDGRRTLNAKLFKAIESFDIGLASELLANGANANAIQAGWNRSALCRAIMLRDTAMATLLLDCGADPLRVEGGMLTMLHLAARESMTEIVERLLEQGANPNAADLTGCTPLFIAAHNDAPQVIGSLLGHGANLFHTQRDGDQAIHIAAQQRSTAALRLLLDEGFNVDARGKDQRTAVMLAARAGCAQTVAMLLDASADAAAQDKEGRNAIHYLIDDFDDCCASLLVAAGCQIDGPDSKGRTPASLASRSGQPNSVLHLIAMGADSTLIPARTFNGLSALHAAARVGWGDQVLKLLAQGADPHECRGRKTIEQVMEEGGHQDALSSLRSWLANQCMARIRQMTTAGGLVCMPPAVD